jgi:haloalkane dehalogenase
MKTIILGVSALLATGAAVLAFTATREGAQITPEGEGKVATASGEFEAFPLPDYAAAMLEPGYKSYLVEVEPGIKMHVLESGTGSGYQAAVLVALGLEVYPVERIEELLR